MAAQDKLWWLTLLSTLFAKYHSDEQGRKDAQKNLLGMHKDLLQQSGLEPAKPKRDPRKPRPRRKK